MRPAETVCMLEVQPAEQRYPSHAPCPETVCMLEVQPTERRQLSYAPWPETVCMLEVQPAERRRLGCVPRAPYCRNVKMRLSGNWCKGVLL